jgi:small-conductance mechanosensitive channel
VFTNVPRLRDPVELFRPKLIMVLFLAATTCPEGNAQVPGQESKPPAATPTAGGPAAPEKVEIIPAAHDDEIAQRLLEILNATGWFTDPQISVRHGVVFLKGRTDKQEYRTWSGELARNTEGVVAVVNQIEVQTPPVWDFSPAQIELQSLARGFVRGLPLIVVGLLIVILAYFGAKVTTLLLRGVFRPRLRSRLLGEFVARACGFLVFMLGLYFVLRLAGLTRLAATVIGGTGLVGLILGIAFRDITENFLASLFLSVQQPFREGDLIAIADTSGYVQRLTSRTTILMTLDGNQVQIPNATVFRSAIRNYTSSPNRREDFTMGIGTHDSIPHAQQIALEVLADHPAVLAEPEPWVLVDGLGAATVNLRVYFWLDGSQHSWLKVKSSVIRLTKRAFQDAGISLPDEAREIIFPHGVPVRMLDGEVSRAESEHAQPARPAAEPEAISTEAEAGLHSEADDIEEQARKSWAPDRGENLLETAAPKAAASSLTKRGQTENQVITINRSDNEDSEGVRP